MTDTAAALETCAWMIQRQVPNFLRLYANPHVAQAILALNALVARQWQTHSAYPAFLANSGEEALSGAIKLARYDRTQQRQRDVGNTLIIDPRQRFPHWAASRVTHRAEPVTFLPGIHVVDSWQSVPGDLSWGTVVVDQMDLQQEPHQHDQTLRRLLQAQQATLIVCMGSAKPVLPNASNAISSTSLSPDIVVFDDTAADGQVPFGAFLARPEIFQAWMRKGMTTFHSTTYQPNTIACAHLLRCLQQKAPDLLDELKPRFQEVERSSASCLAIIKQLYNPSLAKLIAATGFAKADRVMVEGHYVHVGRRKLFDGVAGVACSLRGHNPPNLVAEVRSGYSASESQSYVQSRLQELTGLAHHVPGVSGGSAVEHALQLALCAQSPRTKVVALRGGFGGKTLLALTGTWKSFYKQGLDPLYPDVQYIDPFATDAKSQLARVFSDSPVAVVQLELVQGVGGVRAIPDDLLRFLHEQRQQHGYLIFVDEVQTGMYRTGPYAHSTTRGCTPDLMAIGKGTSDMVFPFSLTLYNDRVAALLTENGSTLPQWLSRRYGYPLGYQILANTLRRAEQDKLEQQVQASGDLLREELDRNLRSCRLVRDVRSFGLLAGIELNFSRLTRRLLGQKAQQFYLLEMMRAAPLPLIMGFCQYETNVLKLTPPLSITADEIRLISRTLGNVLRSSPWKVAASGVSAVFRNSNR